MEEQQDGRSLSPEDYLKYALGRERTTSLEMLESPEPDQVRLGGRIETALMEKESVYDDQSPNSYGIQITVRALRTRADVLETVIPLGIKELSKKEKKAGLEDEGTRERLVLQINRTADEIMARKVLTEKEDEQEGFADDVEQYCVTAFTRAFKKRIYALHYGRILGAEATYEGLQPYGEKVATAVEAFRNIAEGKALVKLTREEMEEYGIKLLRKTEQPDGTLTEEEIEVEEIEGTFPNIFALPFNLGLLKLAIDKYVVPSVGYKIPEGDLRFKLERKDNSDAAMTAYLLFRHWDYPLVYALGTRGVGKALDPSDITMEDISLVNLDIGRQGTDASKLIVEMRRMMELSGGWDPYSKNETREHPRAAGAFASLGCYPTLTAAFPQLTMVEGVRVARKKTDGEPVEKRVKMTIDMLCFGDGKVQMLDRFDDEGNSLEEPRLVEYFYEKVPLTEIPWDKVVSISYVEEPVFDDKGEPKLGDDGKEIKRIALDEEGRKALAVALGVNADAFEIPYKLEQFYATLWMFSQFMRTDFPQLYDEILGGGKTPELLVKMSKAIQVAMGMMGDAHGLDKEATTKLENYVRTVFLGSVGVAITMMPKSEATKGPRRKRPQVSELNRKEMIINKLIKQATITGFLTTEFTDKGMEVVDDQRRLLEKIINERIAPLPGETGWFTKAELIKLAPLYPLIPFPQ